MVSKCDYEVLLNTTFKNTPKKLMICACLFNSLTKLCCIKVFFSTVHIIDPALVTTKRDVSDVFSTGSSSNIDMNDHTSLSRALVSYGYYNKNIQLLQDHNTSIHFKCSILLLTASLLYIFVFTIATFAGYKIWLISCIACTMMADYRELLF